MYLIVPLMVIITMPLWVKFTSYIDNNIALCQLCRVPCANDLSILGKKTNKQTEHLTDRNEDDSYIQDFKHRWTTQSAHTKCCCYSESTNNPSDVFRFTEFLPPSRISLCICAPMWCPIKLHVSKLGYGNTESSIVSNDMV